ncbi:vacuolar protein sorting-associated protein 26c [Anaeramoeba flamelloides]|uniref:Vacuolar protein sorting-associated protein 26c n=1 Tax=Anaeramoeba flamelloides TaxID=1746091 RepID=A0AAV8AEV8_9EUKA|nr:vacuolar protein sorting-associated protein 26c [Anaeramoeba flamelloides]
MITTVIRLKKKNKTYTIGDNIEGVFIIYSKKPFLINSIDLNVNGVLKVRSIARNVEVFDKIYDQLIPIKGVDLDFQLNESGEIPSGKTEIPFEFPFQPLNKSFLFETYHGVYLKVIYLITIKINRKGIFPNITNEQEIYANLPRKKNLSPVAKTFCILPESLKNIKMENLLKIPPFKITGKIDNLLCPVNKAFTGVIKVEQCTKFVRSIELQLLRIETCGSKEIGLVTETTEIQNLQIADGNILNNLEIPMYIIFPRLFCCPTVITELYRIEFELNILIHFENRSLVCENFPIQLVRLFLMYHQSDFCFSVISKQFHGLTLYPLIIILLNVLFLIFLLFQIKHHISYLKLYQSQIIKIYYIFLYLIVLCDCVSGVLISIESPTNKVVPILIAVSNSTIFWCEFSLLIYMIMGFSVARRHTLRTTFITSGIASVIFCTIQIVFQVRGDNMFDFSNPNFASYFWVVIDIFYVVFYLAILILPNIKKFQYTFPYREPFFIYVFSVFTIKLIFLVAFIFLRYDTNLGYW